MANERRLIDIAPYENMEYATICQIQVYRSMYGGCDVMHFKTEAVPAVDAVEVVRCRDCQKSRELDQRSGYERMFNEKDCVWCRDFAAARWRYDYCSDGERRSETQGEKAEE